MRDVGVDNFVGHVKLNGIGSWKSKGKGMRRMKDETGEKEWEKEKDGVQGTGGGGEVGQPFRK